MNAIDTCPICQSDDVKVYDSRSHKLGRKRWRACLKCEHRWTTLEIPSQLVVGPETATNALAAARGALESAHLIIDATLETLARYEDGAVETTTTVPSVRSKKGAAQGFPQAAISA